MWEKRISHEGLNTFRVVRGYTQEEVELMVAPLLKELEALKAQSTGLSGARLER